MYEQACIRAAHSSSHSSSTRTILTSLQRSNALKRYVFELACLNAKLNATYIGMRQIYHPNVDLEGNVCLNILREDWKPVLNLNSVMVGLQYLFLEPNAEDPLNKGMLHDRLHYMSH